MWPSSVSTWKCTWSTCTGQLQLQRTLSHAQLGLCDSTRMHHRLHFRRFFLAKLIPNSRQSRGARMYSNGYGIVALRDDVMQTDDPGFLLHPTIAAVRARTLDLGGAPSQVQASKSRYYSASAIPEEVTTDGICHPTCRNIGGTSVRYGCWVDSCSAVVVAAPGDNVSLGICELGGVALSLLWKLNERRYYYPEHEVLVHFTHSATIMGAVSLEAAPRGGNATSQMLVSLVRALIKEFKRMGRNLVFVRHNLGSSILLDEALEEKPKMAACVLPMVPVKPYKPAPMPQYYPQRTHTLSVLSTVKLVNDELPKGFRDFGNPESLGIKIEPPLGDRLSDPDWCKFCGVPVTTRAY